MKLYNEFCDELRDNGGILKDKDGLFYYKPGYMLHRVNGPAWEWHDGNKEWWYNNKQIMKTIGDATPEQVQEFLLRLL